MDGKGKRRKGNRRHKGSEVPLIPELLKYEEEVDGSR